MKRTIREYIEILVEHEIVRRYVLINSFDGALTVLGIILAEFFSKITDPTLIILPGLGAAIAMCVSGIWGAYSAERAEIKKSIRSLEAHLLKDLTGTQFQRKRQKMAIIIGFVDGMSPLLVSLLILIPFFMAHGGLLAVTTAYWISFIIAASILFLLGALAGRIAKESIFRNGLMMLVAGIVIAIVFLVLIYTGMIN